MDTPPTRPGIPNISAVTLGVRDVEASRDFYVEGLGFRPLQHLPGEIAFVAAGHGLMLALWNVDSMPGEYGEVGFGNQAPPVSLGHNTDSAEQVDRLYRLALAAGAEAVNAPSLRDWGGTSACIADPDGYRWDFVHNPAFRTGPAGRVELG
ncbi:VOC family protein [Arthrobacter sp. KK5.5]|uniref:VOC family protein n=1 Tax=Arthrobacter sp. KK5.5 TaxID=3373084 RepID=UPI003EE599C1